MNSRPNYSLREVVRTMISTEIQQIIDPIELAAELWPNVTFYRQQREVIYSVANNDETYVPAGNMLGKDFVAGFICMWFFLTRSPCRIVTTSAKDDHLRVLWGEIGRYVQTCKYPLEYKKGGPLILNHQNLRKVVDGKMCPLSYMTGMVASKDSIAAMQGHHVAKVGDNIPRTLFISDESSSVPDEYHKMAATWANRILVLGNTWPCANFFYRGVTEGDVKHKHDDYYYRKVIRIRATDSPNVRLALAQIAAGKEPTYEMLVPGVKDYAEYQKNVQLWDEMQKTVSLDAEFYEGAEVKMFPPVWMLKSRIYAQWLLANKPLRKAKAIGIDPAEGGDKTSMVAVDEYGVLEVASKKTPDTAVITAEALAFMRKHGVPPERVVFDRGGGGKPHADRLREQGYNVVTVGFGESVSPDLRSGMATLAQRVGDQEDRYVFVNRRAEMYGRLMELLDPSGPGEWCVASHSKIGGSRGFGIPAEYKAIFDQLRPIPKQYDSEGRMYLPPKKKPSADSKVVSLTEMIGHSPDEADALVLACYGLLHTREQPRAGVIR